MKILITMAGKGSRFHEVGVTSPKHEIPVRGQPMFDWAMRSLEAFFDDEFVFVTHQDHSSAEFLDQACSRLGIDDYRTASLSAYTNGQASTAIAADELLEPGEAVAIYNIDTYIQEGQLTTDIFDADGVIPTFTATGERWSFVRHDEHGNVEKVSEKEKISDHATAGLYYFDEWRYFVDAYKASAKSVESTYGETYVAPLYNHLIQQGRDVRSHEIDREAVHVLGTPTDLRDFDPTFSRTPSNR